MSEFKDTNPKDAVGIAKAPMSTVSSPVLLEMGLAMMEGALKYGRHNYRIAGVRASVYYDAAMRHLMAWWEGEDIDPDSGLSHVTKALATLAVIRDSMIQGNWVDDRPPVSSAFMADLNARAKALLEKYPQPVETWTQKRVEDKPKNLEVLTSFAAAAQDEAKPLVGGTRETHGDDGSRVVNRRLGPKDRRVSKDFSSDHPNRRGRQLKTATSEYHWGRRSTDPVAY